MSYLMRKIMGRAGVLMDEAKGDEGGGGGGGSGSSTDGAPAASSAAPASGSEGGEGGSKPTDAEAKLLKEVMDKKNQLKAVKEQVASLQGQLAQFEGIDVAAVRAMLADKQAQEAQQLEAKGDWDRLKAQMAEAHGKEKQTLLTSLSEKETTIASLQSTIAELTVGSAFSQSKFIADELALTPNKTRVVYGSHFEFVDGKVVGFDKPAGSATRTQLVDASGDPLDFESALKKIVNADPDREQLLRSKVKTGASSSTAPKTGLPSQMETAGVTGRNKIAAGLSKGGLNK